MIGFFLYLIVAIIFIAILLPSTLCFILKKILHIQILTLKIYTFTHLKSFLLKLPIHNTIWGIQPFILSIPDIQFHLNIKTFRLTIQIKGLQAFFVHNNSQLHQIKIIDGLMQPNILANLLRFVLNHKSEKYTDYNVFQKNETHNDLFEQNVVKQLQKKVQKYFSIKMKDKNQDVSKHQNKIKSQQQQQPKKSRLSTLIQGGVHFLVMMIVQFLQLQIIEATASFVSNIPPQVIDQEHNIQQQEQKSRHSYHFNNHNHNHNSSLSSQKSFLKNQINFSTPYNLKSSLLLLRHLSEHTLKIPELSVKIQIINHYQEQIQLRCAKFEIINWSHPSQSMVKGKQFFLGIKVPVTLNISQSLRQLEYGINVESLKFNTVPSDYVMVMRIIKSFSFSYSKLQQLFINKIIDKNIPHKIIGNPLPKQGPQSLQTQQTSINVEIQIIDVIIEQLYEMSEDEKQAQKSLQNISEAWFGLRGIVFKKNQFKIEQSTVKINKFRSLQKSSDAQNTNQNNNYQEFLNNLISVYQEDFYLNKINQ